MGSRSKTVLNLKSLAPPIPIIYGNKGIKIIKRKRTTKKKKEVSVEPVDDSPKPNILEKFV
jgi:hypothetical protein